MKILKITVLILAIAVVVYACKSDIDEEKPVISIYFDGAFPINCDTIYIGDTNTIQLLFTDNKELGSYSINIHDNFDHHSHSTEVEECSLEEIKDPVNPFILQNDYTIPEGLTEYKATINLYLPNGDNEGAYDEGDYHFFISLVDAEGWSSQMGLSIKILKR